MSRISEVAAALERNVRAAELAGAELIAGTAQEKVKVDPDAETHLRDAIHTVETDEGVFVVAGDNEHWWGHLLEHGTVKMAAQPFLIPATEEKAAEVVEGVRRALHRSV